MPSSTTDFPSAKRGYQPLHHLARDSCLEQNVAVGVEARDLLQRGRVGMRFSWFLIDVCAPRSSGNILISFAGR